MRVIVALDGGPLDTAVCNASAYLCEEGRDTVVLATIVGTREARETISSSARTGSPPPSATPSGVSLPIDPTPARASETRDQAVQRVIDDRVIQLRGLAEKHFSHVPSQVRVEIDDDVPGAIIRVAREAGANGVAVGARRQSSLSTALLGSVATDLVRNSPVPVLIIREGMAGT